MTPTHDLCILQKSTDKKQKVGAGWLNPDGRISIVLNLCTTLTSNDDIMIALFPKKDWDKNPGPQKPRVTNTKDYTPEYEPSEAHPPF